MGIDPGSLNTGYGVVTRQGGALVHVCSGALSPGGRLTMAERLLRISDGLCGLIEEHRPDAVSIESVFAAINVKSAIALGQARGAALVCAARFCLPVFEYAPSSVKLAVTGYGQATKEQVQKMVGLLLKTQEAFKKADASDALAMAICHIHHCRGPLPAEKRPERASRPPR